MKKIYFRNSENWTAIIAHSFSRDESIKNVIALTERDADGDFILDFDEQIYDHIYFSCSETERSGIVYPGKLSLGVEYKKNEGMGRNLTYLFSKNTEKTGRVENFVLLDEENLSHREDKSKKISVFLPESYDGKTPHDILYFFDAQNLFCNAGQYTWGGDPYGSWQVDIIMDELHRQYGRNIIVVGIDNADMYRSQELFMNPNKFGKLSPLATAIPEDDFSKGYLEGLSSFMVTTLHSFIKDKYCVKDDNIGIGGSSMGGIASFFCGLYEMGFYSYVLSYSPAYGLYEMEAYDGWFGKIDLKKYKDRLPKIHIYCGGGDPLEQMLIGSSEAMKDLLINHGYDERKIFETYDVKKPHNEESWRLILPESFTYLLDL